MRASERAYAALLDEIQRGILPPGTVLGEVEQSQRLGVSRTPMREAMRRLTADGLIAQQSPRVTVVTDFDADDIRKLFVTRRALEETAARIAATQPDRDVFGVLARSFEQTVADDEGAIDAYYALIAEFDAAVDVAVDNAYLTQGLRAIRTHLTRARRLARDNSARLQMSVAEHNLIARAIADGDAELAAHATHVHLHNALTSILESIREGSQ
ncbi:GntR family transcriptional regulator [Leucobacter coleopterorum]|uniref:GntR family transcriptional regulator n=1 Tax=Leucobacter coleopterorum TaxID=2714933 RepID=A0ABX6JWT9_9MICO|nr:GntR family transcriptional regulator [Leucobacter coleopterorum]QIM18777.1 GntR family transcriptional regulator [Leucobacter coleopterorum]